MVVTETSIFFFKFTITFIFCHYSLPTNFSYQKMIGGNMNVVIFSSFLFSDRLLFYRQFILHINLNIEIIVVGKKYATYTIK